MSEVLQPQIIDSTWPFPLQRHFDHRSLMIDLARDEKTLEERYFACVTTFLKKKWAATLQKTIAVLTRTSMMPSVIIWW